MDDFSDDGFDDLPDNALQELENTAIQFTQAQTQALQPTQSRKAFDLEFEDDDFDDTVVFDELAQHPAKPPQLPQGRAAPAAAQPRQQWNGASVAHPHIALSNRTRYQNSSQPGAGAYDQQGPPTSGRTTATFQRPPPPRVVPPPRPVPPPTGRHQHHGGFTGQPSQFTASQSTSGAPNEIIAALQARVNALQKDLTTTKGESALLRNKLQDAQAAHEADLQRLRKLNAEKLAEQERIAEQALAAEKTAATELQFVQQDLRGGNRHRKGKKPDKERDNSRDVGSTTPKKGAGSRSNWVMADGFDDTELVPSPSKGAAKRSREPVAMQPPILSQVERTPTKGKRKRPALDSPLLELETDDAVMLDGQPSFRGRSIPPSFRPTALPFDFLTLVLDHGAVHGQPLTFDLFARYSFPSDTSQTFASLIFSKLPLLGNPHEPVRLLIDFVHLLIELWSQCLHEKYYEPIYDLVALLSFTLQLQTIAVAPHVISYLLPIAQATIHLLAIPLFESPDGDLSNTQDPSIQRLLADIDTTSVLGVMYLTALGCLLPSPKDAINPQSLPGSPKLSFIQQYWGMIQPEFVLTMLSSKQKPEDLLGMLILLRTSSFSASIGPLTDEPGKNVDVVAPVLIDRISYFLAEPPARWAPTRSQRQCEARLAALETLVSFARSPFGLAKLVQSNQAIPRVVAALSGAIDQLYDMDIPSTIPKLGEIDVSSDKSQSQIDPVATQDQGHHAASIPSVLWDAKQENENITDVKPPTALLHALIATSVSLLHKLVMAAAAADENVASKLAASHGAAQRYLLTLARLNFAEEDLVLEAGISAETAELANELLELAVTPDEGEGVRDVFEFGDV